MEMCQVVEMYTAENCIRSLQFAYASKIPFPKARVD